MKIRGVIWGKTLERAERMLADMTFKYTQLYQIPIVSKTKYRVIFKNGDSWSAREASYNSTHGYRCHIGYIDSAIDPTIVQECIIPCCSFGPFNAVHYFHYDIETFDEGDN